MSLEDGRSSYTKIVLVKPIESTHWTCIIVNERFLVPNNFVMVKNAGNCPKHRKTTTPQIFFFFP